MSKKIAILTSGGDCPGLNAVINAATLRAINTYGWEVYGILQGTNGLIHRPLHYKKLIPGDFPPGFMRLGGTILGTTNFGNPFKYPMPDGTFKDCSHAIIEGYHELGLHALIGIGGDGSLSILRRIAQQGKLNLVGIPKTIDNDLGLTERSIGFSTAVDVATEALDRLQPTAASHDRVMILEVMGRDAGHIALHAGIAGSADIILVPEIPYSLKGIAQRISELRVQGRNFSLVVVAESVLKINGEPATITYENGAQRYGGIAHYLADEISRLTNAETRYTVLGHVQRGGQPNAIDRLLANVYGVRAVDLIAEGKFDHMVAWINRQVKEVSLQDAIDNYQAVDPLGSLVRTARGLGVYVGDEGKA